MEFRFLCPSCGEKLKADEEESGRKANCPHCGFGFAIPPISVALPKSQPAPSRDTAFIAPNLEGEFTCPVCWLHFDTGDVMHIAVHDSLRGDPVLGEDGPLPRLWKLK